MICPGAAPAYKISVAASATPPMLTDTGPIADAVPAGICPVATAGVSGPKPVPYAVNTSPTRAGVNTPLKMLDGPTNAPVTAFTSTTGLFPSEFSWKYRNSGEAARTATVCGVEAVSIGVPQFVSTRALALAPVTAGNCALIWLG